MCFHFCISFFSLNSNRNYKFYNCAVGVKICVTITWSKKHKSINKEKLKKHDKIVLLAKSKLNRIEILISKFSNHSNISHDDFVLVNNLLKGFYDMNEEIKNSNDE